MSCILAVKTKLLLKPLNVSEKLSSKPSKRPVSLFWQLTTTKCAQRTPKNSSNCCCCNDDTAAFTICCCSAVKKSKRKPIARTVGRTLTIMAGFSKIRSSSLVGDNECIREDTKEITCTK
ncbi:Uncharacterised protein [Chlamydia trachomatis]|nr:Uncharacterised protein [Chlamydia trachomatis]